MTELFVNETGQVLFSSHTPKSPDELIDYKLIIDHLVRTAPTTEITVVDAEQVWFSGIVGNIGPQFNKFASELGGGRNVIFGTKSSDKMSGTPGDDYLVGDAGNDLAAYDGGDDVIVGGSGTDSVYFTNGDLGNISFNKTGPDTVQANDNITGDQVTLVGVENALFFGQGYPIDVLI